MRRRAFLCSTGLASLCAGCSGRGGFGPKEVAPNSVRLRNHRDEAHEIFVRITADGTEYVSRDVKLQSDESRRIDRSFPGPDRYTPVRYTVEATGLSGDLVSQTTSLSTDDSEVDFIGIELWGHDCEICTEGIAIRFLSGV